MFSYNYEKKRLTSKFLTEINLLRDKNVWY